MNVPDNTFKQFHLGDTLKDHDDQVRGVCPAPSHYPSGSLLTCSLDKTIKLWEPQDGENGRVYTRTKTFVGHSDFIIDLKILPITQDREKEQFVSIGHDKKIIIWDCDKAEAIITKENAHEGSISALKVVGSGRFILTGSWDKTIHIWNANTLDRVTQLVGHEGNVLAIEQLGDGTIISGAGNNEIRIWSGSGKLKKSIPRAHTSCVRSLTKYQTGFASTSNDGFVRIWTKDGEPKSNFQAHDNLVYSVITSSKPLVGEHQTLITSSEDQQVKFWKADGNCLQRIYFPSCLWTCAELTNGDMAVACADGNAYILTQDNKFKANDIKQQAFDDAVKESKEKRSGIKMEDLDDVTILTSIKGKTNNEMKVVNDNGTAMCYLWDLANEKWECIGEYLSSDNSNPNSQDLSQKQSINGVLYDRVWDVEIDDTGAKYKLGYNLGDDPYAAAQQFILNHGLRQTFLDEIAEFVMKQTGQNFAGDLNKPQEPQTALFDPYAAAEREERQKQQKPPQNEPDDHFPVDIYPTLRAFTKPEKVLGKILENNNNQMDLENHAGWKFMNQHLENIPTRSEVPEVVPELLYKMMQTFSGKALFPILDIVRLVILNAKVASYFENLEKEKGFNIISFVCNKCLVSDSPFALKLMGMRIIINTAENARPLVIKELNNVISTIEHERDNLLSLTQKQVVIALGKLLLSISILLRHLHIKDESSEEIKSHKLRWGAILHKALATTNSSNLGFAFDAIRAMGTLALFSALKADEELVVKMKQAKFHQLLSISGNAQVVEAANQLSNVFSSF